MRILARNPRLGFADPFVPLACLVYPREKWVGTEGEGRCVGIGAPTGRANRIKFQYICGPMGVGRRNHFAILLPLGGGG